jgi:putative peptide zinc metalloprotease protein
MYTHDTRVSVHPFTRQLENGEMIIGRPDTGVFLALPVEAVEVLDQLAEGRTVGEVQRQFQQTHGELLDMDDFLGYMESKGLLHANDNSPGRLRASASGTAAAAPAPVRYHFTNIPQSLAQRLFGAPALALYGLVIALGLVIAFLEPDLVPDKTAMYFGEDRTLKTFVLLLISYVTVFNHEMGHLVAARARGVSTRLGISHRLWFLVAESDLTGLWGIAKRQRYLPLLAGPLADAVTSALLLVALYADHRGWLVLAPSWRQLAAAIFFVLVMRIVWQCFFFVRTDFYYVVTNVFNCRNLLKDTEGFLRNWAAGLLGRERPVDLSKIPPAEMRVIHAYSVVWVLGRVLAYWLLLFVSIPFVIHYYEELLEALRNGWSGHEYNFLDALFMALLSVIPFLLGMGLWIRNLAVSWRRRTA